MDNFKLFSEGDFQFTFYIEKAIAEKKDGTMYITGVASTTNVDHDNERMSPDALKTMATIINEKSVPLRVEHNKDSSAIIGQVVEARVDDRNSLWIKAILDPNHSVSPILHKALIEGAKYGLSVGGRVKKAVKEFVESAGKIVKTFYDVVLDEVSVTQRPANYDAWLLAKSISDEVRKSHHESLYREFIFENPNLDYLRVFAKSIPDKSWQKVVMPENIKSINKTDMNFKKETETDSKTKNTESETDESKTKAADDKKEEDSETTKYASVKDFEALKSMVTKGFSNLVSLMEKMTDTETESKTKATDSEKEETETSKGREGQEDTGENGTTDATREAKAQEDSETKEQEKAQDSESDTDTYEIKSVGDALERIKWMHKKLDAEKASNDSEDTKETETTKSIDGSSMEQFVVEITKFLEKLDDRFAKSGYRVPGLTQRVVEMIRTSPDLQEALKEMVSKDPSFKKSRSVGIPFIVDKSGKRYSLVAQEVGADVRKSSEKKDFKEVYKTEYSAFKGE